MPKLFTRMREYMCGVAATEYLVLSFLVIVGFIVRALTTSA